MIPPVAGHASHTQEIVSPTADEPDVKRLLCSWQAGHHPRHQEPSVRRFWSLLTSVTEEEVVVGKRAVAKEEVRVKKDVVEDTEVVEEDVRREEIDIDDETCSRRPGV